MKIDSAASQILDGSIADGVLITKRLADPAGYVDAVRKQLYFSIGQLNQWEGSTDANRAEIRVSQVRAMPNDATLVRIKYQAHLIVAWPREVNAPQLHQLVMPGRLDADGTGTQEFYDKFGAACVVEEDVTAEHFWHDIAPETQGCPLKPLATSTVATSEIKVVHSMKVARVAMALAPSSLATQGRKPEYTKVWADGKLIMTAVFGKDSSGSMDNDDLGVLEFRRTYGTLVRTFGQPITSNVSIPAGQLPTTEMPKLALTFNTAAGPLDVVLFLVDSMQSVTPQFMLEFPERSKISDYMIYSGHSGYGANIQAFVNTAQFVPDQYQVFLVDGCLTFSYLSDALRDRHQLLNPTASAYEFVDIVANAMPAPFGVGDTNILAILNGLVGRTQTYRDILGGLDQSQRAVVFGEEDND